MKIQDSRTVNKNKIQIGDFIHFSATDKTQEALLVVTIDAEKDQKLHLIDLETGETYFRDFDHELHIYNHLNKHFVPKMGEFEIIKNKKVKVVFE